MRPAFHHEMATARVADLRQYAARERTAQAASRARPQPRRRARLEPGAALTGLARRAPTPARDRSPAPAQ